MDSDLAWVNGKSGRQSWRYADIFQRSIILEAIYHLFLFVDLSFVLMFDQIDMDCDGLELWIVMIMWIRRVTAWQ